MLNLSALKSPLLRAAIALSLAVLLLSSNALPTAHAVAGDLDPTFGSGGKVTTDFFGFFDSANAVAIQSDGRIVAGGSSGNSITGGDFALTRYNTDGSVDTSFGTAGKTATDFGSTNEGVSAIAIQSDGKIVAGGHRTSSTDIASVDFALARYNSDGSLDTGFGSGGKVTTNFGSEDRAQAIIIQPDGKIVLAGITVDNFNFGDSNFALARYNSDGSLDTNFGVSGKVSTDFFGGGTDRAFAMARQPNGKIIVAGFACSADNGEDVALVRYNTDGSLDTSFGAAGKVTTDFGGSIDQALALAVQNDRKIVAAGFTAIPPGGDFLIVRYEGDVTSFDICLEDDSSGDLFKLNSTTGDYQFTDCSGFTISGTGSLTRRGSTITLQHMTSDRRVMARLDGGVNKATASVQMLSQGLSFTITDRNTANNTCSCR